MISAAMAMLPASSSHGGRDAAGGRLSTGGYELIVFEADGCVYCEVFRRDVLPLYAASDTSRSAPLRFVNLTYSDESRMGLAAGITIAPTVVLMQHGREVDRIAGYTGPDSFLRLVGIMMGKAS